MLDNVFTEAVILIITSQQFEPDIQMLHSSITPLTSLHLCQHKPAEDLSLHDIYMHLYWDQV